MPTTENGTVPPRHLPNSQKRPCEYLTPKEVEELIAIAKMYGRYGHRDATMISPTPILLAAFLQDETSPGVMVLGWLRAIPKGFRHPKHQAKVYGSKASALSAAKKLQKHVDQFADRVKQPAELLSLKPVRVT